MKRGINMNMVHLIPAVGELLIEHHKNDAKLLMTAKSLLVRSLNEDSTQLSIHGLTIDLSDVDVEELHDFIEEVKKYITRSLLKNIRPNTESLTSFELFERTHFIFSKERFDRIMKTKKFHHYEIDRMVDVYKRHFEIYMKVGHQHVFVTRKADTDTRQDILLSLKKGHHHPTHIVKYDTRKKKELFFELKQHPIDVPEYENRIS